MLLTRLAFAWQTLHVVGQAVIASFVPLPHWDLLLLLDLSILLSLVAMAEVVYVAFQVALGYSSAEVWSPWMLGKWFMSEYFDPHNKSYFEENSSFACVMLDHDSKWDYVILDSNVIITLWRRNLMMQCIVQLRSLHLGKHGWGKKLATRASQHFWPSKHLKEAFIALPLYLPPFFLMRRKLPHYHYYYHDPLSDWKPPSPLKQ